MRERGLKHFISFMAAKIILVAPHAGAWIETVIAMAGDTIEMPSLPMRERGLKPD